MSGRTLRKNRNAVVLLGATVVAGALWLGASPAWAQSCPAADPSYTGPCGPTFVLPGWGDAGGWTDPSQWSTIQLADVDGDGDDELFGRTPAGIAIHDFDKTLGEWRPQVNANDVPVILGEFANPPALTQANPNPSGTDWTQPWYYDTIQAADIDGQKGEEILARGPSGMMVFKYGSGGWSQLSSSGPFSDSDGFAGDPSTYTTIQTADLDGNGDYELLGRAATGLEAYDWNGSSWSELPGLRFFSNANGFESPQYYATIQTGDWGSAPRQNVSARFSSGIAGIQLSGGRWQPLDAAIPFRPFADGGPGCCFSNGDSFADSPSYYSTIEFANVDGFPGDELMGRGADGLVTAGFAGDTPRGGWVLFGTPTGTGVMPVTLDDVSDANGWSAPQYYETIQYADIDGNGAEELLARGAQGLVAYSYTAGASSWNQLAAVLPLQDDPWANDASYYATIQSGDVDGDGRDDVIGRGPYGIRTWFYNRRGTGGWERYLPYGYSSFPTAGQQAAFSELSSRLASVGVLQPGQTPRDVWDGENPPAQGDLSALQAGLSSVGGCSGETSLEPPQYANCTVPAGSSGFDAADWTAVMNEIFAEVFWAEQVLDHLAVINNVRQSLFIQENAELPAIGSDLQLAAAANVSTSYNIGSLFSGMAGIAGSIAGPLDAEASAALWVVSEIISMLPSASPTFTSSFTTTYNQLQTTFANGISEVDKALAEQSQLIRGDLSLLRLVGQLRHLGTWNLDQVGMTSAGAQGFAQWVYKTLLPTIWTRYDVTNCQAGVYVTCSAPQSGGWMVGSSVNFTAIGVPPTPSTPCSLYTPPPPATGNWTCQFVAPPSQIANLVWGLQTPNCAYQPGNANTAWAFGCSLGEPSTSVTPEPFSSEAWGWTTVSGDPQVNSNTSSVTGRAGDVGARRSTVRLSSLVSLRRPVRLGRATVYHDRLLFDRGGAGELVRPRARRKPGPPLVSTKRRRLARGWVFESRRGERPHARVRLTRVRGRRYRMDMLVNNSRLPVAPDACRGTRTGIDFAPTAIPLHTRLRLDDGRGRPAVISLKLNWRCRRNGLGQLRRLVVERPSLRRPSRGALKIRMQGSRRLGEDATRVYRITVRNTRPTTAYDVLVTAPASRPFLRLLRTPGARVRGGQAVWRLRALRPGRARTVRLRVRVAQAAKTRICQRAFVQAINTRIGRARACTHLRP